MLEEHFNEIVDSKFTANLEEKLDEVAESKQDWQKLLWEFYEPFIQKISEGKSSIQSQKLAIPTGELCPLCGKELVRRSSRYGEFVGCSGYPKCKYIKKEENPSNEELEDFGVCEKCGQAMVKKRGRNGEFLACSGYPKCKNAKPLKPTQKSAPQKLENVQCPKCGGDILERNGRYGKFYSCGNHPKCDFIAKFPPINQKCPKCGSLLMRRTFRNKPILECSNPECKERMDDTP